MSKLQRRGSIAWAAVVVVLLWSRPANAQVGLDPGQPPEPGGLLNNMATGAARDIVDQAKAERRLQHVEARLARDAAQCDPDAVARDAWRAERLRYRIVVDEWLIRKTMLCNPGNYPYPLRLDPMSCAAIGQYRRPPSFP